ncbi:MAG: metallophosphoesterase [Pseudomonadota bacterium]
MAGQRQRKMRRRLFLIALVLSVLVLTKAWFDTMGDPVVQRAEIESDALAVGASPITIALISDIHVAGPDMPPERLADIVRQINALKPDLVAIAGDLASEKRTATHVYTAAEVVAPLAKLDAPLGTVLVPGNHDHWFDWPALQSELNGIDNTTVLANEAVQIGPLVIGGVDDDFTDRADLAATVDSMAKLEGARVVLTHSPDIFPQVPVDVDAVLAGHTHCGQIAYPWGGSPATMSDYGDLYACGVVEQHNKTLITTAGLGTSLLPIRLFTQPEIWLITIRPPNPWRSDGRNSFGSMSLEGSGRLSP